jgi:hypothetical protein
VFINGTDISGGGVEHEECPLIDEFLFHAPDSILITGTNLLEVHARDRGGESYLELRVLVEVLPPQCVREASVVRFTTRNIGGATAAPSETRVDFTLRSGSVPPGSPALAMPDRGFLEGNGVGAGFITQSATVPADCFDATRPTPRGCTYVILAVPVEGEQSQLNNNANGICCPPTPEGEPIAECQER